MSPGLGLCRIFALPSEGGHLVSLLDFIVSCWGARLALSGYMLCLTILRGSERWLKNELGFVYPSSSVHLEAGIGVGPIG